MNGACLNEKGEFKLCPYRVFQEEKKSIYVGNGDMVIQMFYPCAGKDCVAYQEGVCLRVLDVIKRIN